MRGHQSFWILVATGALLAACDKKAEPQAAAPASAATAAAPVPDVGKLESVKVTSEGFGATASEAVSEAMKLAILQVNGAAIDMSSINTRFGLDVTLNQDSASLRGNSFSDAVRQRSGGVIQNFRVTDLSEPMLPRGKFKATIEAGIAKFAAPTDLKKIKLVVAPLRLDRASVVVGDRSYPAAQVAANMRQRILDALVQTGRFAVLDREFSPDLQQELDMIASGNSPSAEMAKLSQAVSADLIWSGRINGLAYNRHARQLRTSNRELVSYSGGWSVTQKLVNVATRQVMTSDSLRGVAPSTEPTTLSRGVDSDRILGNMTTEIVNGVVASILTRTFPITIVSLQGTNAILSQGGQAVRPGAHYAVVTMGSEMKDPQTGQSLGRTESPCCELVIDRVTPNLSYGHIENAQGTLDNLLPGALQVREPLAFVAKAQAAPAEPRAPAPRGKRNRSEDDGPDMSAPAKTDEKW